MTVKMIEQVGDKPVLFIKLFKRYYFLRKCKDYLQIDKGIQQRERKKFQDQGGSSSAKTRVEIAAETKRSKETDKSQAKETGKSPAKETTMTGKSTGTQQGQDRETSINGHHG
ncbi:hypothetical protein BC829DRAFT_447903 [Chytridium lagenaria]|nr:hypothetical protein BC829DRAFT_447903 [Chytridium lagenaria]